MALFGFERLARLVYSSTEKGIKEEPFLAQDNQWNAERFRKAPEQPSVETVPGQTNKYCLDSGGLRASVSNTRVRYVSVKQFTRHKLPYTA